MKLESLCALCWTSALESKAVWQTSKMTFLRNGAASILGWGAQRFTSITCLILIRTTVAFLFKVTAKLLFTAPPAVWMPVSTIHLHQLYLRHGHTHTHTAKCQAAGPNVTFLFASEMFSPKWRFCVCFYYFEWNPAEQSFIHRWYSFMFCFV